MKNKIKVISAFPGTGKTYAVTNNKRCIDSDSSKYSWLYDGFGNKTNMRNPIFPNNYIHHIKECIENPNIDYILVSSHDSVKRALDNNEIEFISVYPMNNKKHEYLDRIRKRDTGLNDKEFISILSENWENWIPVKNITDFSISDNSQYKYCKISFYLDSDIYLSDVIKLLDDDESYTDSINQIVNIENGLNIYAADVPYDSAYDLRMHQILVTKYMDAAISYINNASFIHDDSKLSDDEKPLYDKVIPLLKGLEYGSKEYKRATKQLGPALKHHFNTNRHHPEYFEKGISGMNLMDLIEMVSDWLAASQRDVAGDINKSLEINKDRFNISDQLMDIIKNTITYLQKFNDLKTERD